MLSDHGEWDIGLWQRRPLRGALAVAALEARAPDEAIDACKQEEEIHLLLTTWSCWS
jgi:hypothetical protein